MKTKDERILEVVHEIARQDSLENQEFLLDHMLNSYLHQGDVDGSSAHNLVIWLKKLLKVTHEDFFSYENLLKVHSCIPQDSYENRIAAMIRDYLNNDPKWEIRKGLDR